jgi:hypothetical protein
MILSEKLIYIFIKGLLYKIHKRVHSVKRQFHFQSTLIPSFVDGGAAHFQSSLIASKPFLNLKCCNFLLFARYQKLVGSQEISYNFSHAWRIRTRNHLFRCQIQILQIITDTAESGSGSTTLCKNTLKLTKSVGSQLLRGFHISLVMLAKSGSKIFNSGFS